MTVVDSLNIERQALINYVSPPQINFHLPPGTAPGNATIIYTNTLTGVSQFSNVFVGSVNPGIFSFDGTGGWMANAKALRKRTGFPDVYEETARHDGNQWVPIPIDLGPPTDQVILVLFGTGWRFRSDLMAVSVTIGGIPCFLFYAGTDGSEHTGVDQANVLLPRSLAGRGLVDIVMTVDGLTSNTVQVSIR